MREERAEQREAKAAAEALRQHNIERQRRMDEIMKQMKEQEEEYKKQHEHDGGRTRER